MKYYAGIDVGGTKTDCLVADETGRVRGFASAGSGSHEYHGIEHGAREVRKAYEGALGDAGVRADEVTCVGLGVAGADQPDDYPMLEKAVYGPLLGDTDSVLLNDSFAALRGGMRESSGIVIACGTGVICAGISPTGERARAGGWMPEYGDMCTGETIGLEGLKSVWRSREGIVAETKLTELFMERAGADDVDKFFYDVYNGRLDTDTLQPMAQLVFRAGSSGDAVACEILEAGGRYLGMMINAVTRKLCMTDTPFEVCTGGSVFSEGAPVLHEAMEAQVGLENSQVYFHKPIWIPVVGALLLGFEKSGPVSDAVHDALSSSLIQLESVYTKSFNVR